MTLFQLGKLKRILSLEVDSGAIIFDRKHDTWHLYNAVHEYKKYGPLREIVQCGDLNFCRLDSAVLVSKNTKILNIIAGRFGALTVDCDNVYFIPVKSQIYQDTITPQIVKINAKTGIYRKYEYPEQFIGDKVISSAIYGNKIWISFRASSECGEDWESCVVLDDVGEKNKIKPKRLPWHLARLIIPSDTALFVSTMDGLYKVTEHDSLLRVVAYKITMDAQQLIDKKRIVLRNYDDYFTQKISG